LWGTTTWHTASTAYTPLRFPGQYYDPETRLHYNYFRYYDPATGRYLTSDPLGLTAAPNPVTYVDSPHLWTDPLGLYNCKKVKKIVDREMERASGGGRRLAGNYHGHLTPEREMEIIANPDGVYISQGGAERLIFHQGEDVVVMESKGSAGGNIVTSYGPSGPRNESGAAALGGSPTDPGPPVTREQIINGEIPTPGGGKLPPSEQVR
ncbi:RHS repeat-associated core domain-containing protein, partial [Streptomyces albus]